MPRSRRPFQSPVRCKACGTERWTAIRIKTGKPPRYLCTPCWAVEYLRDQGGTYQPGLNIAPTQPISEWT